MEMETRKNLSLTSQKPVFAVKTQVNSASEAGKASPTRKPTRSSAAATEGSSLSVSNEVKVEGFNEADVAEILREVGADQEVTTDSVDSVLNESTATSTSLDEYQDDTVMEEASEVPESVEADETVAEAEVTEEPVEHCLLCGVCLEVDPFNEKQEQEEYEDVYEEEPITQEEVDAVATYDEDRLELFLQHAFQLAPIPAPSKNISDKRLRSCDLGQDHCRNFCARCKVRVARLYELHQKVKRAEIEYDSERDKLALKFIVTFLGQTKPTDFPPEVYKSTVAQKWKRLYTGETEKERQVMKMLKERETRALSREKKLKKLKASCKPMNDNGKASGRRKGSQSGTGTLSGKTIRHGDSSSYILRIPRFSRTATWPCTVCDKKFNYDYSLRIHLRTHASQSDKLYKCSLCTTVCNTRQKLMEHRRKDHTAGERQVKCKICPCSFANRAAYKNHMRSHVAPSHACEICAEKFTTQSQLKLHMAKHKEVDFSVTDLFTCNTCSMTFLKSQDLTDHLRIHSDSSLKSCKYCGKVFSDQGVLDQHMKIHTGSNPFICDECGKRFPSAALHSSHLKTHRPRMHVCKKCNKACRSRDGLRKHELTHTGKKPFSCNMCNMGFIERKSFDAHMIRHTGQLPYKCNFCDSEEGFKDAKDLRRHKYLKHPQFTPNDKIYACEVCWNGFDTQESLEEHKKKVHERYKCQFCTKVFKLGDHLRRHMYIHTGEKPYKCGLCEKSFNQESNLKEHMYRHTGIRPHRCPHCPDAGYLRRMHLREHMMKAHGTDIIPHIPVGRAAQSNRKSTNRSVQSLNMSTVKLETEDPEMLLSGPNSSNCIIVLQSK